MIKYIPLNQNILQAAIQEIDSENCLLLFPTRKSKKEALKLYQPNWDFTSQQFLTMDEWKELLFLTDKPILKEEKRTLALYQAMQNDQKEFFKIKSYHQFIDLAQNFFSFWEEISEEQVDDSEIIEVLNRKQTAGNWQLNTFGHLQKMKLDYAKYLFEIGFSDQLFMREQNEIISQDFEKIIVVNQFYFTNFEKRLLKIFEDKTTILTQIPQSCFDEEKLEINPDFNAENIKPFIKEKIDVFTSEDETNMIADLAVELSKVEKAEIIDFQFNRQPYAHLLSSDFFSKSYEIDFSQTRFYRFWQHILQLLNSKIQKGNPFLLSMNYIFNLVSADDIFGYFLADKTKREEIRTWLFQLIDNDFKFIDLDFVTGRKPEFKETFSQIFEFLQKIDIINSIENLISFISENINLKYLLEDFQTKSDLAEVFYSSLADFVSIESIGLVQNWKSVFPSNQAANLIKLLLDYLKPKKNKLNKSKEPTRYNLTSLQDTRNLQFENMFILNVVEGVLPDRKHTQFLLSENQRKELGLKTYEDITLRDKYYFYRLLCSSRNVKIFTRYNLEENIEISSFLEELKLNDSVEEHPERQRGFLLKILFDNLLNTTDTNLPDKSSISDDFFSFPFYETEFPQTKLSLSFYKWEKLKNNPFEFYLEFVANLKKREVEISNDFSSKLIGNIAHEIINLVFERLVEVYHSSKFKHNFVYNTKLYVDQAIKHYLEHNQNFTYLSPHNFSERYFHKIFLPILAAGIENFFYRLHNDLHLSEKVITVLPENKSSLERDFIRIKDLDVCLKGRPDLRIHTDNSKYIFDFKTGSVQQKKALQLQFYEEIYYLIDQPELQDKISSFLFFVEQKDMRKLNRRIDLKEEIFDVLEEIFENGFAVADKSDRFEHVEITRRDLVK
ncbi:MAG: PD-(D/E)XK nuclease family protein [Candidatus Cloacimonetes bacterium]|nr:PD-(D/E)XK nuclease family protein [Candidatus Cloacimonadota bacterium]MCF7813622.1 PD-(D/E)XK nuclease family protein [Candidatus Cloacimonadota bacterium]MCF7868301.1 PD-(D/E)XK nuclease family protein [Candidatus Cloacimonadota bacterium]MCF7883776.1 PD-(D/E)XK nuclease family protein [Candidatus Cloacimonadota bacterium]